MMTDFFRRSEEEEEINENSEISSSNNDKKTELYLSPFEAFYLSFGLGCLVVREEENDELHLTIGKKYIGCYRTQHFSVVVVHTRTLPFFPHPHCSNVY